MTPVGFLMFGCGSGGVGGEEGGSGSDGGEGCDGEEGGSGSDGGEGCGGEEGGSGSDGGEGSGGELTVSCKIINMSIITIHTISTMSLMLQNNIVWPSY